MHLHHSHTPDAGLTEGVIWKKLLRFAFPILLGNIFQQLYNTADSLIVGHFLDQTALAAVSSSGSLILLLVGLFNGAAMGSGVLIANCYGAKDQEGLRRAVHTDLAFGIAAGLALTVVGVAFTPTILRWMGTPENVLPHSIAYFRVYFCGAIFIVLYNICVGILQAVGDSRHPLHYLILSSLVNVGLDLLFVGVFRLGVYSAALATTISQGVSVLLCLRLLLRNGAGCQVRLQDLGFHLPTLKNILRLGLPSGAQNSIISFANIIVQSNINAFGDTAMAGCGSYAKLEGFAFLPITCFSMALCTFVSQNLGAGKQERVRQGVGFGVVCSMVLAEVVGVVMFLFAPQLVSLFSGSPEVVAYGARQARMVSLFYCLLAFSHCIAGILRGCGKSIVPMVIMVLVWCLLRITYITTAIHFVPHIEMVFSAYPLTWAISSLIFLIYFRKADWIHGLDRLPASA